MANKKNIFIGLGVFIAVVAIVALSSSSDESFPKEDLNADWFGKFEGACPSYNMTDEYGEPMIVMGNYIELPSINWTYEIFDKNKCNITMTDGSSSYPCYNVDYSVVSNNDSFTLTMKPESSSDCGGNEIILIKEAGKYKIAKTSDGQPSFVLNKVK